MAFDPALVKTKTDDFVAALDAALAAYAAVQAVVSDPSEAGAVWSLVGKPDEVTKPLQALRGQFQNGSDNLQNLIDNGGQ